MQLFLTVRKSIALMGIDVNRRPLNRIVIFNLIVFAVFICCVVVYLYRGAVHFTFIEITEAIYLILSILLLVITYIVYAVKMDEVFQLLNGIEKVVNDRKWLESESNSIADVLKILIDFRAQKFKIKRQLRETESFCRKTE